MNLAKRIDTVVERLRSNGADFRPIDTAPWILSVEARIGRPLPETYRSLVTRYSFSLLELGPVVLFSNQGNQLRDDITSAPFKDPILLAWLTTEGYFHFARSAQGDYDPICLDLTPATFPKASTAVVKFDHEAILCGCSPVRRETLSESFLELLEEQAAN